jgi:hypothetical protein
MTRDLDSPRTPPHPAPAPPTPHCPTVTATVSRVVPVVRQQVPPPQVHPPTPLVRVRVRAGGAVGVGSGGAAVGVRGGVCGGPSTVGQEAPELLVGERRVAPAAPRPRGRAPAPRRRCAGRRRRRLGARGGRLGRRARRRRRGGEHSAMAPPPAPPAATPHTCPLGPAERSAAHDASAHRSAPCWSRWADLPSPTPFTCCWRAQPGGEGGAQPRCYAHAAMPSAAR